ncbi:MAG TPA: hypothetical protein VL326_15330 [Kofleriaceae bacterium]|nr:hypothetical protein [Kofleriaceae bacterium]
MRVPTIACTLLVLVAMVAACKRGKARPAETHAGSATSPVVTSDGQVAVAADATAPASDGTVDLLRAVPSRVAVSSLVNNPSITPFDLVDGDLETAWSSKTGELVGAWIAFRVPPAAHVTQIELTAGFVSKGNEGDYFTLNPRIKHVVIYRNGTKLLEKHLDITVRGIQSIPIGNEGGDYKIEVAAIEPGAKKTWRETCVSELRVIGTAPDMQPNHFVPEVTIGSLDAKPLADDTLFLAPSRGYASLKELCAAIAAADPKHTYVTCGDQGAAAVELPEPLPAGWTRHWFCGSTEDPNPNPRTAATLPKLHGAPCWLALEAKNKFYLVDPPGLFSGQVIIRETGSADTKSRSSAELLDVAGGPDKDLVIYTSDGGSEWFTACSPTAAGAPACGWFQFAEMELHNNNGGDQFDEYYTYKWEGRYDSKAGGLITQDEYKPHPIRVLE